jgi:NADPH2:quinone reductase
MRAAYYSSQGPAHEVFKLGEQPTPEPGPGEVRVRLAVSGVNPSDWKVRKGGFGRKLVYPVNIPHSDGAGIIDAVGAGVSPDRIGERVWIWNGQWQRAFGTAAEFIALPARQAVKLPDNVDFAVGACLGIPALTAIQAVRLAGLDAGKTLLIAGGAGSVGHYAVQFAKRRGARIIATISGAEKAAHAIAGGADAVIDYRTEDVGTRLRELAPDGVDAVIEMDLARNAAYYPQILKPYATVVIYGMSANEVTLPTLWLMMNNIRLQFLFLYTIPDADREAGIAETTEMLQAGTLINTIAARMPLEEIADAHDLVEQRKLMGNIVLDIA